jgi:hypothetical protein
MRTLVHGTLVFWLNVAAPCVGGQLLPFVLATSVQLVFDASVFYFVFFGLSSRKIYFSRQQ